MSGTLLRDPWSKRLLRSGWSTALGVHAIASIFTSGGGDAPRLYYGGARAGDVGGPLVKVKRLRARFAEYRWRYNLVYVLSNTPYLPDMAIRLLQARGIPIVHNQDGVFCRAWYAGDWRAANERMARTYHAADHVFYQSAFCRCAADEFLGSREGPGEVLYNAIDTTVFTPAHEEARRGFRFLITGKIDAHLYYRLDSTIRGLAETCKGGLDATLEIAGVVAADARSKAESLASELGISERVHFTGPYSQAGAPDVYRRADAYVMTKHNDPCPNAVLEALACGLPVIYSESGGVPELVGPAGIGLPCEQSWDEPKWPQATMIAAAMAEVAPRRAELAAVARSRAVEHFDIQHWLARHAEVFEELLERRSS